jgi:hypothetical protein
MPLSEGKSFMILYDNPSEFAVTVFIDEIYESSKQHYRNNYFFINYDNPAKTELDKMKWLFAENMISENECNVVVDEIMEALEK